MTNKDFNTKQGVSKFDGTDFRVLYGYEYNQASGRAGRRGRSFARRSFLSSNCFKKNIETILWKKEDKYEKMRRQNEAKIKEDLEKQAENEEQQKEPELSPK